MPKFTRVLGPWKTSVSFLHLPLNNSRYFICSCKKQKWNRCHNLFHTHLVSHLVALKNLFFGTVALWNFRVLVQKKFTFVPWKAHEISSLLSSTNPVIWLLQWHYDQISRLVTLLSVITVQDAPELQPSVPHCLDYSQFNFFYPSVFDSLGRFMYISVVLISFWISSF